MKHTRKTRLTKETMITACIRNKKQRENKKSVTYDYVKKETKPKAKSFENTNKIYKTKIREDANKLKE